jgi:toxin ParE1/3/4
MTVVWSARAIANLTHLRLYISRESPTAAARMATRILASVDLLAEWPHIGRPGRVAGTRELVIPDTPYVIPYRVHEKRLELIAVLHERQRWPKKFPPGVS